MYRLSYELFSRTVPFALKNGIKIATETFGDAVNIRPATFLATFQPLKKPTLTLQAGRNCGKALRFV